MNTPRYQTVDDVLPAVMPAITRKAILPFYLKLIAAFGKRSDMPVGVAERHSMDYTSLRSRARMCWASSKPTRGHHKGWGRMIHDASHHIQRIRHPSERPHGGSHVRIEREMAEYVMAKGWMVAAAPVGPQPKVKEDPLPRILASIERWERKAKRAKTALAKLERRRKYYEKRRAA